MTSHAYIATNCVCCGMKLTDETSIAFGMGPVCRRKHIDKTPINPTWGKALGFLGVSCPAHVYDAVVACLDTVDLRHDALLAEGHIPEEIVVWGWSSYGVGEEIVPICPYTRTWRGDVTKAIKAIVHQMAVALEARETRENIARYILAVDALGCHQLARHLCFGMNKRVMYRDQFGMKTVTLNTNTHDGRPLCVASYPRDYDMNREVKYQCRAWFLKEEKSWAFEGKYVVEFLRLAVDFADIIIEDCVMIPGRPLTLQDEIAYEWGDDAEWNDAARLVWIKKDTGEFVRYALPGEPEAREGYEKVPAEFFGRRAA